MMKILLTTIVISIPCSNLVLGFSPSCTTTRTIVAATRVNGFYNDWTTYEKTKKGETISKGKFNEQRRKHKHDIDIDEMMQGQKDLLELRRSPDKMDIYNQQVQERHEKLDHQHDLDLEKEINESWVPDPHPLIKTPYDKSSMKPNMIDDVQNYFSKEERDHRGLQHHLELLEMETAENEVLERRRDPSKMNEYHAAQQERHELLDKRHEIEKGFEFAEEQVLEKGQILLSPTEMGAMETTFKEYAIVALALLAAPTFFMLARSLLMYSPTNMFLVFGVLASMGFMKPAVDKVMERNKDIMDDKMDFAYLQNPALWTEDDKVWLAMKNLKGTKNSIDYIPFFLAFIFGDIIGTHVAL